MATYRPPRIAPDLPNSDPRFDDDTPPASPYINRLPPRPGPALRVGGLFSIPLPRLRTVLALVMFLVSLGYLFAPQQYRPRVVPSVLTAPKHEPSLRYKDIDWRKYAYTMHAADVHHVCACLMVFEQLEKLGSKAERVLLYPHDWDEHTGNRPSHVDEMLQRARDLYKVHTRPVKVHGVELSSKEEHYKGQHRYALPNGKQMDPSITKFLALGQTRYLRVIYLEAYITLLKHLDEMFLAPPARMGATRQYLNNEKITQLSAHFFVTSPREQDEEMIYGLARQAGRLDDSYDSNILNEEFGNQAMILSHRYYGLNSAEFRRDDHFDFMGNEWEDWNPERVLREASMVVFDEEAIPRPWVSVTNLPDHLLPHCSFEAGSEDDIGCRNRKIWTKMYNEYARRRKDICRMPPVSGGILKEN